MQGRRTGVRREQRKVAVFQAIPSFLLTSMVGLGLRSPDRKGEADTWRGLSYWGNNEAADHWEQSHFGLVWVGHLSWRQ